MNKCVHELAQKTGQDEELVEFTEFLTDVPSCGLLQAINQGKITVDELNGTNGKSITVQKVKEIVDEVVAAREAA